MWLLVLVLVAFWAAACGGGAGAPEPTREAPEDGPARRSQPPPSQPRAAWTHDVVLRRIHRRRIRVAGRTVRVDRGTVTCGGVGRAAERVGGEPAWTRFRCVQPTFPAGSVAGPDAIFFVEPTGPRTSRVTGARLTSY